jgi:hypothetical protein
LGGEEDDECLFYCLANVCSESESTGLTVFSDELFQAWFVDGHHAVQQAFDFPFVNVNTGHVNAELSEARSRDESYITSTDNSNMH